MKRIKSGKPDNNGFTLIELLVALLITGILMVCIASVFLMSQKIYMRGGDISYKQKNITNVETELQNVLAVATAVNYKTAPAENTTDKHYFNLGFNSAGKCVEYIDGTEYMIDQITSIKLFAPNGVMNYQLIPKNSMSIHSGGIVLNNSKNFNGNQNDFKTSEITLNTPNCYLVVEYVP